MGTTQQPLGSSDLGAIMDSLREGIQIVDSEWRYVYVNNAAAEHGRRDKGELIGRTMLECFPGIDQTPMFGVLRACMHAKIDGSRRSCATPRRWTPSVASPAASRTTSTTCCR